jgi:hypothetical protein
MQVEKGLQIFNILHVLTNASPGNKIKRWTYNKSKPYNSLFHIIFTGTHNI